MKAKHVFYLLTIVALLAGTWVLPVVADEPVASTDRAPAGTEALSGSMASFNPDAGGDFCWAGGATQTFCFLSESYTSDWEYAYENWFSFPSDWEVVNVYDVGPNICDFGGTWGTFGWAFGAGSYEVDVTTERFQANPTDYCYTNICFDVVTGSGGDVSWYWSGDGWGNAPHYPCSDDGYTPAGQPACDEMINPVASIMPCADGLYLSPEHQGGGIEPGGMDNFGLTVANLSGGEEIVDLTYTATGPGSCDGPATSPAIPDDGTWDFEVTVYMDAGAGPGDVVDCEIYALGQNSGYDDYAWIHAEAAFPGSGAYGLDVYPGSNLVHWDDLEVPAGWTVVGSVPQFHPAADFLGDNYFIMYALDYDTNQFVTIDTATGARTVIGTATPTGSWTGMTGTADGSTLYASSSNCGVESYLYEVDPATGGLTLIGSMRPGSCMIDIAINAAGDMYGVDIVDDSLYSIDTATGAASYIGQTGASANYAQGMDFDFGTGTLYWAAYTTTGELRTLDLNTGLSTLIGGFGGPEIDGLAITGGGEPQPTIHVEDIQGFFTLDFLGRPVLRMFVAVADDMGDPMSMAEVTSWMWVPDGGPFERTRLTKPTGWARFHWGSMASGTWTLCVQDLALAGYVYDPDQNVVTCEDWYY